MDGVSFHQLTNRAKVLPEQMTGRARMYLAIAAVRHLLIAASTWLFTPYFTSPSFGQIRTIMPLQWWGILFAGAGLTCGIGALIGRETLARVGLILSASSSALWAGGFLAAALTGHTAAPTGVIIWWAVAFKDLVVCRQPLRSPFEPLVRMLNASKDPHLQTEE